MFKKYYFGTRLFSCSTTNFYYIKNCYFYYELGEYSTDCDYWHTSRVYRDNTTTGLNDYFLRNAIERLRPNIDRILLDAIKAFELAEILHSIAKQYIHQSGDNTIC